MSDIKHVEEPIDETEDIDLGLMLAPLSRQQLEMLICQMISRHPEEFDIVKDEATKDVDVSIYAQIAAALVKNGDVNKAVGEFEEIVARVPDFIATDDIGNALSILESVCEPFVGMLEKADEIPEETTEERIRLDGLIASMEDAFTSAFGKISAEKTEKLNDWFAKMAGWRTRLTDTFGPLFSDPLRALKKKIRKKPSSSSTAAAATKKQKK